MPAGIVIFSIPTAESLLTTILLVIFACFVSPITVKIVDVSSKASLTSEETLIIESTLVLPTTITGFAGSMLTTGAIRVLPSS